MSARDLRGLQGFGTVGDGVLGGAGGAVGTGLAGGATVEAGLLTVGAVTVGACGSAGGETLGTEGSLMDPPHAPRASKAHSSEERAIVVMVSN